MFQSPQVFSVQFEEAFPKDFFVTSFSLVPVLFINPHLPFLLSVQERKPYEVDHIRVTRAQGG
jgi:hypothetical protein